MSDFQYQDLIVYHYVLTDRLLLEQAKPEYFANSTIKGVFTMAKDYGMKYNHAPSKEELKNIIQMKMLSDEYSDDIIDTIYDGCNLEEYSDEWLRENTANWIKIRNLEYVMRKSTAYMKTSNLTSSNANTIVENVRSMFISETAIDFDFEQGCDFFDAKAHSHVELVKHSTGYSYMDTVLKGGYYTGGLFVLLAGPKCGKSFWLCNLAAASIRMGFNTLYVTLELPEFIVNKRIAANLLNITQDEYSVKCKDLEYIKHRLNEVRYSNLSPMGDLHVKQFPTSTLSVQSLEIFIKKLQELKGIKYKNIVIDYINIMQNAKNPNSENTYLKIKTIAEDLRAIGQANDWTIITVTQTNRDGWETTDLSVKDIAESAGLLHTVDGLFGVITNPEMKTNGEYFLKAMAIRDGSNENTKKRFIIQWDYGRISEDMTAPIEECTPVAAFNRNQRGGQQQPNQPQSQPFQQQALIPQTQTVMKNNTKFKNNAIVGSTFKCIEENSGAIVDGDIVIFMNESKRNYALSKCVSKSIDGKHVYQILKIGNSGEMNVTPNNLSDVFENDKAQMYIKRDKTSTSIGVAEHPMDDKVESMTEEVIPMGTDIFNNMKIEISSIGNDLESIKPVGLFPTDLN